MLCVFTHSLRSYEKKKSDKENWERNKTDDVCNERKRWRRRRENTELNDNEQLKSSRLLYEHCRWFGIDFEKPFNRIVFIFFFQFCVQIKNDYTFFRLSLLRPFAHELSLCVWVQVEALQKLHIARAVCDFAEFGRYSAMPQQINWFRFTEDGKKNRIKSIESWFSVVRIYTNYVISQFITLFPLTLPFDDMIS